MGACGSLSTCNQSLNFCTSRQRVCFTKCGNIRQACGSTEKYVDISGTRGLTGFVEINNTGQCNMSVALTDTSGTALSTFDVLPGQTKMVDATDLAVLTVVCSGTATTVCEGNWAFEGYYDI